MAGAAKGFKYYDSEVVRFLLLPLVSDRPEAVGAGPVVPLASATPRPLVGGLSCFFHQAPDTGNGLTKPLGEGTTVRPTIATRAAHLEQVSRVGRAWILFRSSVRRLFWSHFHDSSERRGRQPPRVPLKGLATRVPSHGLRGHVAEEQPRAGRGRRGRASFVMRLPLALRVRVRVRVSVHACGCASLCWGLAVAGGERGP